MSHKVSSSRAVRVTSEVAVSIIEQEEIATGAKQEKQGTESERMSKHLKLYRAALNGDWQVAQTIYDVQNEDIHAVISKNGYTALHVAAASERVVFVKKLVKMLRKEDITCRSLLGDTAFSFAAASGNVEIARELVNKNEEVAMARDGNEDLPIEMAASLGHREMVKYLYKETKHKLAEKDLIELFVKSIKSELYDVARQLLDEHPDLATARSENGGTALHALALKQLPSSNEKTGCLRRCFNLVKFSGTKNVENGKHPAVELVERLWEKVLSLGEPQISDLIASPSKLIFDAIKQGNDGFLSILIREYPDLVLKLNNKDESYSIFHAAVLCRQENIFKLIYDIGSSKHFLLSCEDDAGNNILHLAGLLRSHRLKNATGPAFQLQGELLWFKEVEKIVQPRYLEAKNKKGLTPKELFTKEHEQLRQQGEKWMKETATSCMVVAALISTVAFAAAFTVPGGITAETGIPFFLQNVSFQIFAIADAISLVSSSTSMLQFLSIFTSGHELEDFLWLSPRKLNVGLVTLFMSIAAMMVMFSATFFILFDSGKLWIAILVAIMASFPVSMFILQHYQLIYGVVRTIYMSDCLFKKKYKGDIFIKSGEASEELNAHASI